MLDQVNAIDTSIYTESGVAILEAAINVANVVTHNSGCDGGNHRQCLMLKAALEGLVWDDTYEVTSGLVHRWILCREIEGATITPNAEDAGKATVSVGEAVPVGNTNSRDGERTSMAMRILQQRPMQLSFQSRKRPRAKS